MKSLLLQKQAIRQYFLALHAIARQQSELLGQAGIDDSDETLAGLNDLIAQRQAIMEEIDRTQEVAREHFREESPGHDPALREAIAREEAEIFKSILEIQSCDEECRDAVERLMQTTGVELNKARKSLQAIKSYSAPGQFSTSQFFDGYK